MGCAASSLWRGRGEPEAPGLRCLGRQPSNDDDGGLFDGECCVVVVVERYVSSALWDQVLAPLLLYKAVFVFAIPGLFAAALPGLIGILNRVIDGDVGP